MLRKFPFRKILHEVLRRRFAALFFCCLIGFFYFNHQINHEFWTVALNFKENFDINCSYVFNPSSEYNNVDKGCIKNTIIPALCVKRFKCHSRIHTVFENDVTLVTQLTYDRTDMLLNLLECKWTGYVVAAMYFPFNTLNSTIMESTYDQVCASHNKMSILFVYPEENTSHFYPVNSMRALAAAEVHTSFLLHLDVDFKIQKDLHRYLTNYINPANSLAIFGTTNISLEQRAFVVPAFDAVSKQTLMPQNKSSLLKLWPGRTSRVTASPIRIFHQHFMLAQGATDYIRWRAANKPYIVPFQKVYEPWLMVHRTAPKPDVRFNGRELNKVAFVFQLYALKYQLTVLPDVFIIHFPHSKSSRKVQDTTGHKMCMFKTYTRLRNEHNITKIG